jgi:hypothetical protein
VWCSTGHGLANGWCRSSARARGFRTPRTLQAASPTLGSATPATAQRGDGGHPQQPPPLDAEPRDGAHGSGVLFEEAQATSEPAEPCVISATRPRPTMSCAHTVIGGCLGWSQSCGRSVYTTCSTRGFGNTPCAVPPGQPELPGPGGHRLRPGWGHKARQKMC